MCAMIPMLRVRLSGNWRRCVSASLLAILFLFYFGVRSCARSLWSYQLVRYQR